MNTAALFLRKDKQKAPPPPPLPNDDDSPGSSARTSASCHFRNLGLVVLTPTLSLRPRLHQHRASSLWQAASSHSADEFSSHDLTDATTPSQLPSLIAPDNAELTTRSRRSPQHVAAISSTSKSFRVPSGALRLMPQPGGLFALTNRNTFSGGGEHHCPPNAMNVLSAAPLF
ncbi:hypothetical protein K525DRAFT_274941 [Schizophyllum commune Loenen D]|nr:hypothetical protein K525DRAFT_274941 [Schizophyllum commune Loenen D]